ncbi:hypothetical protein EV561_105214 [Rhizobium sp. BK376]|nr:hypothetical protein EV561_105214 [Rhizobium sp. BK376]
MQGHIVALPEERIDNDIGGVVIPAAHFVWLRLVNEDPGFETTQTLDQALSNPPQANNAYRFSGNRAAAADASCPHLPTRHLSRIGTPVTNSRGFSEGIAARDRNLAALGLRAVLQEQIARAARAI